LTTVAEILDRKGRDVWSVRPSDSVLDVIRMMAEKGVGALAVLEEDRLVGIVSERDYARKVILQGRTAESTLVREIMTSQVTTVEPQRSTDECLVIMSEGRFRHAPVTDGGRVVGMISIGDLVKAIIDEQRFVISQLEHYITT
jgi:CBS domain-containing protein